MGAISQQLTPSIDAIFYFLAGHTLKALDCSIEICFADASPFSRPPQRPPSDELISVIRRSKLTRYQPLAVY